MNVQYSSTIFDVTNIDEAKGIILTNEDDISTERRWLVEAPHEADIIESQILLGPDALVLDFGCGVGRLSAELINRTGCRAVGVDTSPSMRALAADYVKGDRFVAASPGMLDFLVARGVRFDAAIVVWVLQHVFDVHAEVRLLHRALRPGGKLFVVNEFARAVPIVQVGSRVWANDGFDVRASLRASFHKVGDGRLSADVMSAAVAERTYWESYERTN